MQPIQASGSSLRPPLSVAHALVIAFSGDGSLWVAGRWSDPGLETSRFGRWEEGFLLCHGTAAQISRLEAVEQDSGERADLTLFEGV